MSLADRVVNAYSAFTNENKQPKAKNDNRATSFDFLRYGNKKNKPLRQDWSQVEISDQDMYTGDAYAVINKRANRASALGKRFLYTEASETVMAAAKEKGKEIEHPYLELIRKSKDFSRRKFWHDISTYLDLEGVYYLMAVRAIKTNKKGEVEVGAVQKFQMLNPYQVRRVTKASDGTLGGYIESKDGMYREIPKEMIIEIRLLNPFDNDLAYSMTDAAKETVFTMKQANDYTRHAIKGNINAPGAITTGVELEDHIFDNFVSRIENHTKGEPLYGNGVGAINWSSMQIDLDKAGLDKINDISRSALYSVAGVSDMLMGRQKAGTGREVSKTQKDEFTENAIMPQLEDILDALNLDYRRWYSEWETNEYEIILDNPLEADREAELKDIEIRESELNLRDALVAKGYEYDIASKYAHGDITLEELGEPTLEPELSDQEAELEARKQLGIEGDDEPENGDTLEELDDEAAVVNRATAHNKFVAKEENEKKINEAKKKLKSKDNQKKQKKQEEKTRADDAEEQSEDIVEEEEKKAKSPTKDKKITAKKKNDISVARAINQVSLRTDFPDLLEGLVIDQRAVLDDDYRGCIMINTEKIPVIQFVKNADKDLFENPKWDQGSVPAETTPHATLLYGLLNNGNIWKDKVDTVLADWDMPTVKIKEVSHFETGDSIAVVGLLEETPEIIDANQRLSLLPHLNTFSEYHPHITLAYIKNNADVSKWEKSLGRKYNGQVVATAGLNYGDAPKDDSKTDNHIEDEHDMEKPVDVKKKTQDEVSSAVSDSKHVHSADCANHDFVPNALLERATNALDPSVRDAVLLEQSGLRNAVAGLERQIVNAVIQALMDGDLEKAENIIAQAKQEEGAGLIVTLSALLAAYYTVTLPIYAAVLLKNRLRQFNKQGIFAMTDDVKEDIKKSSQNAAESHVLTVLGDLEKTIEEAQEKSLRTALISEVKSKVLARDPSTLDKLPENPSDNDIEKAVDKRKFNDTEVYELARTKIRQGEGLNTVIRAITDKYQTITETRAKTIANHESSRVFNMSQYQADLQFLVETNNLDRAYKRLRSRRVEGAQCAVCSSLIAKTYKNPIPFNKNFADLGDELTASYKKANGKTAIQKIPISYEAIKAGNVHVNCNCEYELVIKNDDGTFMNSIDGVQLNKFNPDQPRAKDGKWTDGSSGIDSETGMGKVDLSGRVGVVMDFEQAKEDATRMSKMEFRNKYFADRHKKENFQKFIKEALDGKPSEDPQAIAEILSYQANSQHLNRHLAEHPGSRFEEGMTKDLDKAFTWKTKKPAVVYRKLGKDYYGLGKAEIGDTYTEPNYGSSSVNPGEADQYAWGDGPLLVIELPEGANVAVPDLYSTTDSDLSDYSQHEILIPRKSTYEVIDKLTIPDSNEIVVRVRLVK